MLKILSLQLGGMLWNWSDTKRQKDLVSVALSAIFLLRKLMSEHKLLQRWEQHHWVSISNFWDQTAVSHIAEVLLMIFRCAFLRFYFIYLYTFLLHTNNFYNQMLQRPGRAPPKKSAALLLYVTFKNCYWTVIWTFYMPLFFFWDYLNAKKNNGKQWNMLQQS